MYRVLEAKGELRLNDFLYDNVDCGRLWELGGQQGRRRTPVAQDDARRDPRWGWVPSAVPFGYGRVNMQVRDIMGNVWSAHYVNGMFSFRHFDREATVEEKEAMRCRPRDARISDPPLGNPVELALAEGKVFTAMRKDVVAASNIAAHVIQEGQLYQHVARDMYGYHVNWVPGSLHPTIVDGKVTLAARMQSGRAEKKKKQCTSRLPRHPRSPTKAKGKENVVPRRSETPKAAVAPSPKRRRRPGMAALAEIRQLQRSTNLCIALRPFMRVVGEIVETDIAPGESMRFQMSVISALMEAAEAYLINHFERTNIIVIHCKRVTIQLKDLRLVDNLSKARWEYRYQGITDEQKRAEKLRQMNAARQEERDARAGKGLSGKTAAARKGGDTPAASSKRKGAPRKGNAAKKSTR
ncbi:hypothetical protein CBR_g49208 [Chara braunii]|uniref:Core Histone H2A/H2B/H3 domain-containing protein n=1 Tax=Chara braunii TaxID=69332 RepID=A0A388M4A7_CHABU|nr:hypothetical protein CBR_g49208 [Chara braunii]|eukprot:GBG89417.1 hypothetical protein CBR_g49208 [Chara braunii]